MRQVPGTEAESLGDVEVGASVWSESIQDPAGNKAGGVVVGTHITGDGSFEFTVLRWRNGAPFTQTIEGDDIDLGFVTFWGRDARNAGAGLSAWLGRREQRTLDHVERARWARIASDLAEAGVAGNVTPRCHARCRDRFEAERAQRNAS